MPDSVAFNFSGKVAAALAMSDGDAAATAAEIREIKKAFAENQRLIAEQARIAAALTHWEGGRLLAGDPNLERPF